MIGIVRHKTPGKYHLLNDFQIMGSKCQFFITVIKGQIYLPHLSLLFRFYNSEKCCSMRAWQQIRDPRKAVSRTLVLIGQSSFSHKINFHRKTDDSLCNSRRNGEEGGKQIWRIRRVGHGGGKWELFSLPTCKIPTISPFKIHPYKMHHGLQTMPVNEDRMY